MLNRNSFLHKDEMLGEIIVSINRLAKSIIFRIKEAKVHITIPPSVSQKELEKAINLYRDPIYEKLIQSREQAKKNDLLFTTGQLQTATFQVQLNSMNEQTAIRYRLYKGVLEINYPAQYSLSHAPLQKSITNIVNHYLKLEAQQFLVSRTYELAKRHGVGINSVKINSSKGRWGSCSAEGNINLSYFLMKKPLHLIDYVILHELAHRTEMNHSDRFWRIVDRYCGGEGRSKALREELRRIEKGGTINSNNNN